MERAAGPKRYARELGLIALGQSVTADDDLADVMFLDAHPGWTWADLQAAPDDVIAIMRALQRARAGVKHG